jgi:hypothetical protein
MLRQERHKRMDSERVILLSIHWLEKKSTQKRDNLKLEVWCENLHSLVNAVATEGRRLDCFTLFFALHAGEYNYLATPEELMLLGTMFTERILNGLRSGSLNLHEVDKELQDWHSWRDSTDCLAEMVDSLRLDGSLRTEDQYEQAYRLFSQLADDPISSSKASEVLYRLRND